MARREASQALIKDGKGLLPFLSYYKRRTLASTVAGSVRIRVAIDDSFMIIMVMMTMMMMVRVVVVVLLLLMMMTKTTTTTTMMMMTMMIIIKLKKTIHL